MVSTLNSGSSGPGSSPGRGHCVVLLGTQVFKWVPASHPGGINNTPSRFMLRKPESSAGPLKAHFQLSVSRTFLQ